jgi:hypothetical protein
MKKAIIAGVCILLLSCCLLLTACSSKAPELCEVKDRFVYLIEQSGELNVLFFGKGLPVYKRDNALALRRGIYYVDTLKAYENVRENSKYGSVADIKEAAEKIYSSKYLEQIYESAIDGVVTGEGAAYLRFHENEDWLYQSVNATDFGLSQRIYDYSSMEIMDISDEHNVTVTIDSYTLSDPRAREVKLSFVYENGNWYLDSPTY